MQNEEQNPCNDSVPPAEAEEPLVETLPSTCAVNIRGWENDNEAEALEFGEGLMTLTKVLSCHLDLSRLESIVIGWDYASALASVDRGDGIPPAAPTTNEYGQGSAMAVNVIRDDEIWNVVVIWTGLVRQLNQTDHPEYKLALQTFVHELVHVDDLRLFTRTYPGGWRAAKPRDGRDANLQPIVNPCQSEYSAQRRAALMDVHPTTEDRVRVADHLPSTHIQRRAALPDVHPAAHGGRVADYHRPAQRRVALMDVYPAATVGRRVADHLRAP